MYPPSASISIKDHATSIVRVLCAAVLLAGLLMPAVTSTPHAAAAPTTKTALPVAIKNLPASTKSGKNLPFIVSYTLPADSTWSSLEIRLKNEAGKTVEYLEGWVGPQSKGVQAYDAKFELAGSDLPSQVYTVDVTVRSKVDSKTLVGNATGVEPIYRTKEHKAEIALCVRLETRVTGNPDGTFVNDPATTNSRQADEVIHILTELNTHPNAHVTFAIAPVTLEEWLDLSDGYTLAASGDKGDPTEVPATDPTAEKYAKALSYLRLGIEQGRVSLAPLAYSDPDFPSLIDNDLADDIQTQYARGIAVTNSTVTTLTIDGTIPFSRSLPTEAVEPMVENDLTWVVVDDTYAKTKDDATAKSGVCTVEGNDAITALVNDSASTAAVKEGDATTLLTRTMSRYGNDNKAAGPLVIVASVSQEATQSVALDALKTLDSQPWIRLSSADSLAARSNARESITLSEPGPLSSPANYWDEVFEAREDANAVQAILDPTSETATRAVKNSLIAESSAWSQPNGDWTNAEQGRAFAQDAIDTATAVLNAVDLQVEPVTLAKNEGEVPLVISNASDTSLNVVIELSGTSGLEIDGSQTIDAKLEKNDNFFTIPVTLDTNSPSGDLHVSVMAGEKVIDSQTVAVKSSVMNRIFMLTAIALVLIGILVYIRQHVKRANTPSADTNTPKDEMNTAKPDTGEDL